MKFWAGNWWKQATTASDIHDSSNSLLMRELKNADISSKSDDQQICITKQTKEQVLANGHRFYWQ